jgi:hypothetical protein
MNRISRKRVLLHNAPIETNKIRRQRLFWEGAETEKRVAIFKRLEVKFERPPVRQIIHVESSVIPLMKRSPHLHLCLCCCTNRKRIVDDARKVNKIELEVRSVVSVIEDPKLLNENGVAIPTLSFSVDSGLDEGLTYLV